MAIFGVGAYYQNDVSGDFIKANLVGVGWNETQAPDLHQFIVAMKVGDIVYIKSVSPSSPNISVKSVGIITDGNIKTAVDTSNLVQVGRNVKWLNTEPFLIPKPAGEKNNVRLNTIYEEYHPTVQQEIIGRL